MSIGTKEINLQKLRESRSLLFQLFAFNGGKLYSREKREIFMGLTQYLYKEGGYDDRLTG